MANDRDQSELTFEGMMARVGRFLSRVYRFPHDWGVPEPKRTENDDAFLLKRLEELRIYGCSPVPDWMRRKREASLSAAGGQPTTVIPEAPKVLSGTQKNAENNISGSRVSARDDKNGGSPLPHEQGEGAGDPSGTRGNITEHLFQKRPKLFRYDAKRLKRLIASAEHMIRCLIIWRAYRAMRDEKITPRAHHIPTPPPAGTPRRPQAPIHPNFAVRGLPLYEPKAPPFRISMPMEISPPIPAKAGIHACEFKAGSVLALRHGPQPPLGSTAGGRKLRNDDLSTHERLYLRLERLDQLYDEIDKRGRRLAARWAGEIYGPDVKPEGETEKFDPPPAPPFQGGERSETASPPVQQRFSPLERGSGPQDRGGSVGGSSHPTNKCAGAGDPSRRRGNITEQKYEIRPLKSHDPPSDLLETTDENEAEDLHILHDVAIRTAGEFHLLCG